MWRRERRLIRQHELTGTSGSDIKSHNRRAVLLALLQQKTLARVRLARITGLSSTTITNLIAELLAEHVVEELGTEETASNPGVGRPRTALRLVPESRYAIGIHFGVGSVRVAVANLVGHPLIALRLEHSLEQRAEEVLGRTLSLVKEAIDRKSVV